MSLVLRGGWAGVNIYEPGGHVAILAIPRNHLLQADTGFQYTEDFEDLADGGRALAGIGAEVMVVTMNIDDTDLSDIFDASDQVTLVDVEFVSLKDGASVRFNNLSPSVSGGGGAKGTFLQTRISGVGYAHSIADLREIVVPASP
jgi:hypothetical protein